MFKHSMTRWRLDFSLSASHSVSKTRSFHSLLYEVSKYHTWSQHKSLHREWLACLCNVCKSKTLSHYGEVHIKMTNKNTLMQRCYMNTSVS